MSNQPIEEKWKEELSYLCDSWDYNYDRLEDFIENLLEQERQRMSDEIEKKATFHEVAVSNVEVKTTRMVRLDDVKAIIKTR